MFNSGVNTHGLKWRPRLKVWKSSNNVFDPATMHATSYGWWTYFTVIKGLKVFNDYYYSQATSGHQSELRTVLKQLKIKIDVEIKTPTSLDRVNMREALERVYSDLFDLQIKAARSPKRRRDRRGRIPWAQRHRLEEIKRAQSNVKAFERLVKLSKRRIAEIKAEREAADLKDREFERSVAADRREAEAVKRAEAKELLNSSWINVA